MWALFFRPVAYNGEVMGRAVGAGRVGAFALFGGVGGVAASSAEDPSANVGGFCEEEEFAQLDRAILEPGVNLV